MHVEFILQNNMHALSKIVLNNKYFDNKLKPYFQKEKKIKYILENTCTLNIKHNIYHSSPIFFFLNCNISSNKSFPFCLIIL